MKIEIVDNILRVSIGPGDVVKIGRKKLEYIGPLARLERSLTETERQAIHKVVKADEFATMELTKRGLKGLKNSLGL